MQVPVRQRDLKNPKISIKSLSSRSLIHRIFSKKFGSCPYGNMALVLYSFLVCINIHRLLTAKNLYIMMCICRVALGYIYLNLTIHCFAFAIDPSHSRHFGLLKQENTGVNNNINNGHVSSE